MPAEIIQRKEGGLSQKQEIRHQYTQFSLNSYGHLCIREFDDPITNNHCSINYQKCPNICEDYVKGIRCEYYKDKVDRKNTEHLIVLDQKTTDGLIKFIFENRSTYEFKEFIKNLINKSSELPF